jgi:hypothetical protein
MQQLGTVNVSEVDIVSVLKNCKVELSQDERVQLQAFVIHKKEETKDGNNVI